MKYGAKLNLTACGFDEPEYRKKSTDTGGACYRTYIVSLGKRWSADIGREPDSVPIVGGEFLKIISHRANPELVGLLVDYMGRRHPVG
jgi:hypothetical protein